MFLSLKQIEDKRAGGAIQVIPHLCSESNKEKFIPKKNEKQGKKATSEARV